MMLYMYCTFTLIPAEGYDVRVVKE